MVRDYILEWMKKYVVGGVERELKVAGKRDRIISIIGPRRAGKTYYFYQLMSSDREDSLYLNFEDTRLMDVEFREIRDVIRIYVELSGKVPHNIFFDEVQNVDGWEYALRELLDQQIYNIFVTGSSSKLLSKEIATQLRGRTFPYILLPFSFREFLRARGILFHEPLTMDENAKMRNFLREYLEYGGFPEVVFEVSERDRILKEYSEMILFKDIVERHKLRNISLTRFLLNFFLQNFSNEFSVHRVLSSSEFRRFGKNTLYDYVDKFQDSIAIFFVNRYSPRVYVRESWPKKIYLCDTGLSRVARFSEDLGKLMENTVFLELLRLTNRKPLMEIYYWRDSQQREVDFVLKEGLGIKQLIQVTYASGRDEVEKRKVTSLINVSQKIKCNDLMVITWNYDEEIKYNDKIIKFTPLWRWLLM
ncbi:MAG: ATP-binding protein [Candidatus Methanomethylicia archaeon]